MLTTQSNQYLLNQVENNLLDLVNDKILVIDLRTEKVLYHNLGSSILGHTLPGNDQLFHLFKECVHPDNRIMAVDTFIEVLGLSADGEIVETTCQLLDAFGGYNLFLKKGKVLSRYEDGGVKEYMILLKELEPGQDGRLKRLSSGNLGIITYPSDTPYTSLFDRHALQLAIFNVIPDTKIVLHQSGKVLAYYPSGKNDQEPIKYDGIGVVPDFEDIFPSEALQTAILANVKRAIKIKEVQTFEYRQFFDGQDNHFEARVNAINNAEAIIILRDITVQKRTQLSLEEKIKELDSKNSQLGKYSQSNEQLEQFAYVASHDLREPLRTIKNFSEIIQKKYFQDIDPEAQRYFGFITRAAENMNGLIEDLLAYSRVNTENHKVEEVEITGLLTQVMAELSNFIREKNATIKVEWLPELVKANQTKLKQLFQNLIVNAIKFQRSGMTPEVKIKAIDLGDYWQFDVADNGIGMDEKYFDMAFMIFKKLHNNKDYSGTGIGLAICKRIVEQFGGKIWVQSKLEKGSTFSFTLPK